MNAPKTNARPTLTRRERYAVAALVDIQLRTLDRYLAGLEVLPVTARAIERAFVELNITPPAPLRLVGGDGD